MRMSVNGCADSFLVSMYVCMQIHLYMCMCITCEYVYVGAFVPGYEHEGAYVIHVHVHVCGCV